MNNKITFLSSWSEHLCIKIVDGNNLPVQLDFNRFRYSEVPKTNKIQTGKCQLANRDNLVLQIFEVVAQSEELALSTKGNFFHRIREHIQYCDKNSLAPFTKQSITGELLLLNTRQRRGEIKDTTVTSSRSEIRKLLSLLELPTQAWLPVTALSGVSQREATKGYSQSDLKKMLPFLRSLFKQLHTQFIKNPEYHIHANRNLSTMTFIWEGKCIRIRSGVNKLFWAAAYLLAYYTWNNSKQLFDLKRPHTTTYSLSDSWYKMPAFKRRSFKTLTVEIGANNRLEIPKYALQFFDKLLEASYLINPASDGYLLVSVHNGLIRPMNGHLLQTIRNNWFIKKFPMTDDQGEFLTPLIRRFRATGGHLIMAAHGPMKAALLLDNTPNTVKISYSEGNPHENNRMLRDTAYTLEQAARDRKGVDYAKKIVQKILKTEVLSYEEYLEKASPPRRNAHGSYCKKPFGQKANVFTKRAFKQELLVSGEKLACADLVNCFGCEHQVLVEEIDDLWCLLSFREYIEESIYLHTNKAHFQKNFGETLERIDSCIKQVNNKILSAAQRKLNEEGRHPLWPDVASTNIF